MGRTEVRKLKRYRPAWEIFSLFRDEDQAVFLDSSLENRLGRYSIIGRRPYLSLRQEGSLFVNGIPSEGRIEDFMKDYLAGHREENLTHLPMISGAIGYFSYDYGRRREGVPSRFEAEPDLIPEAIWNFYDELIIEDLEHKQVFLTAGGHRTPAGEALDRLEEQIEKGPYPPEGEEEGCREEGRVQVTADSEPEEYRQALERMRDHIEEGDIYIANLTRQLVLKSRRRPYEVFLRLRRENPSPFGGYFQYGGFQVVSASPERFLRLRQGQVETRPIKGTRRRGKTRAEDDALREELRASEKDRSELLMIVDLERNDLSRVCVANTVRVPELFAIEEYATVFHLVSTVTGILKEGMDAVDLARAAFPGGSVTGAPKRRAMEIIDRLERGKRGLYTGSMGYFSLDGCCDLNIVIRTLVCKNGRYHLGVGGGITCESEPEFEYEETWQKAAALIRALR